MYLQSYRFMDRPLPASRRKPTIRNQSMRQIRTNLRATHRLILAQLHSAQMGRWTLQTRACHQRPQPSQRSLIITNSTQTTIPITLSLRTNRNENEQKF